MTRDDWTLITATAAIVLSIVTLVLEFNIWLKARAVRKLNQKWDREDFEQEQLEQWKQREQRKREHAQEWDPDPDEAHD